MINEFNAESLARWKLNEDGTIVTLAFQDSKKNETHVHLPRPSFEASLPVIAQDLMQEKHPEQTYMNVTGLELGIAKEDGSIKLRFDLGTGAPFGIYLPRGTAGMLLDALKSALEGDATQSSLKN